MYLVPPANGNVVDGLPEEQRRVETPHKAPKLKAQRGLESVLSFLIFLSTG